MLVYILLFHFCAVIPCVAMRQWVRLLLWDIVFRRSEDFWNANTHGKQNSSISEFNLSESDCWRPSQNKAAQNYRLCKINLLFLFLFHFIIEFNPAAKLNDEEKSFGKWRKRRRGRREWRTIGTARLILLQIAHQLIMVLTYLNSNHFFSSSIPQPIGFDTFLFLIIFFQIWIPVQHLKLHPSRTGNHPYQKVNDTINDGICCSLKWQ